MAETFATFPHLVSDARSFFEAPRGLASNSGFEDREAIEAAREIEIKAQLGRALFEIEALASVIWTRGANASPCNEQDFIDRWRTEFLDAAKSHCKPNTLPEVSS